MSLTAVTLRVHKSRPSEPANQSEGQNLPLRILQEVGFVHACIEYAEIQDTGMSSAGDLLLHTVLLASLSDNYFGM